MRAFALFIAISLAAVPAIAQNARPAGSKFVHIQPAEKMADNRFDSYGNYPASCAPEFSCIKLVTQPGVTVTKQTIVTVYETASSECGGRRAYGEVALKCFEDRVIKAGLNTKLIPTYIVEGD